MFDQPQVFIDKILIAGSTRIAQVWNPFTDSRNAHGLGTVGEPILDFAGCREEGYELVFPGNPHGIRVSRINYDGPVTKNGRYPLVRVGLDALGAPDLEPETRTDKENGN